jgi:hypothetical protein
MVTGLVPPQLLTLVLNLDQNQRGFNLSEKMFLGQYSTVKRGCFFQCLQLSTFYHQCPHRCLLVFVSFKI